jgi:hypothetical protein
MDLKEVMSVSGHSGLFRFISQGRNGIIVESFTDQKRSFITASQKVSSLGDIAIFTDAEEVPLKDVFKSIRQLEPGSTIPDGKSAPDVLRNFMEKILPNYDRERVYMSDIKKLVTWYNELLKLDLLDFEEEKEADKPSEESTGKEPEEKKTNTSKTKKTAAPKKTTVKK